MAARTIRLGIIGCGLMGREIASAAARWCHLLDLDARPEIVAVASRTERSMEWFKTNFATVRQAATDYRELLANDEVDAVYCAVPHDLHERMYIDVLDAGKHLLGEKPFGIDRAANAAILEAALARPELVARCSSEFPFFPAVQRIVGLAREGRFGRVLEAEAGFLHSSDMDPDKPINWKRRVETNGEYGVMGDLGLHVLHVPLRLGWRPLDVRAVLSNVVPERPDGAGKRVPCETWDNATLLCRMRAGGDVFPLTARMQRIAPGETNTWYLTVKGTRTSARFTTKRPRTLETLAYEPGRAQAWAAEDLGYASAYRAVTGSIFEFGFPDAVQQMLAAFCDEVARGNGAEVPFGCARPAETRATHELFTAALASERDGRVVEIPEA